MRLRNPSQIQHQSITKMATEKSYKDIWEAAREGGLLEVQSFIDVKGKEVDATDPDRRTGEHVVSLCLSSATALHWAAASGHNEIVKYLLSRGAARDPVDEDGWSPLMSAVSASKEDVRLRLIIMIETRGRSSIHSWKEKWM